MSREREVREERLSLISECRTESLTQHPQSVERRWWWRWAVVVVEEGEEEVVVEDEGKVEWKIKGKTR